MKSLNSSGFFALAIIVLGALCYLSTTLPGIWLIVEARRSTATMPPMTGAVDVDAYKSMLGVMMLLCGQPLAFLLLVIGAVRYTATPRR